MGDVLERRARAIRSRGAIRDWEYRQRHHAKGTWFRFRRVLADAQEAYALSEEAMNQLILAGAHLEAIGSELEPAKRIVFITRAELDRLSSKRAIELHISPELLGARDLALVAFE